MKIVNNEKCMLIAGDAPKGAGTKLMPGREYDASGLSEGRICLLRKWATRAKAKGRKLTIIDPPQKAAEPVAEAPPSQTSREDRKQSRK